MIVMDKILNAVKRELKLSKKEFYQLKRLTIDYSAENGVVINTQLVKALHYALKRA